MRKISVLLASPVLPDPATTVFAAPVYPPTGDADATCTRIDAPSDGFRRRRFSPVIVHGSNLGSQTARIRTSLKARPTSVVRPTFYRMMVGSGESFDVLFIVKPFRVPSVTLTCDVRAE